jgi:hypothetical protein
MFASVCGPYFHGGSAPRRDLPRCEPPTEEYHQPAGVLELKEAYYRGGGDDGGPAGRLRQAQDGHRDTAQQQNRISECESNPRTFHVKTVLGKVGKADDGRCGRRKPCRPASDAGLWQHEQRRHQEPHGEAQGQYSRPVVETLRIGELRVSKRLQRSECPHQPCRDEDSPSTPTDHGHRGHGQRTANWERDSRCTGVIVPLFGRRHVGPVQRPGPGVLDAAPLLKGVVGSRNSIYLRGAKGRRSPSPPSTNPRRPASTKRIVPVQGAALDPQARRCRGPLFLSRHTEPPRTSQDAWGGSVQLGCLLRKQPGLDRRMLRSTRPPRPTVRGTSRPTARQNRPKQR